MQDRYAGDVGDFIKFGLLRSLSIGRQLGVAWYLHPDEAHNSDGKHVAYLSHPARWRHLDPTLFDALRSVVMTDRSVRGLERTGVLSARFHREPTLTISSKTTGYDAFRSVWFDRLTQEMKECDLVFADPDNGLTDDTPARRRSRKFAKQMPLNEALSLAAGRPTIVYHHNSRFPGGHDREVEHWLERLGPESLAIRATAFACRTYFILNPDNETRQRAESFCKLWASAKVRLHERSA